MAKELKLSMLQERFTGTIKKENNNYVVIFPNSNREYSYKCNLKKLAEKLKIDISSLLDETNTYNTDIKSSRNRWIKSLNNNDQSYQLLKENINLLPEAITELYNKVCQLPQYNWLQPNYQGYTLYAIVNLKTNKVTMEIQEGVQECKRSTTSYKYYYMITCLGNNLHTGMNNWDEQRLQKHIETIINEIQNAQN
jgi:hypothetical protein